MTLYIIESIAKYWMVGSACFAAGAYWMASVKAKIEGE
jgi:hypothetical protein